MEVRASVEITQRQPEEYEGTVNVLIEEGRVAKTFTFHVVHPFDSGMDLTVKKGKTVFMELTENMTKEDLEALTPEQKVMSVLLTDAIIGGIDALLARLSYHFLTTIAKEFGNRIYFKAETYRIAKIDDPELQKLICAACT